jgi:cyanophycinase-like exopeptidase
MPGPIGLLGGREHYEPMLSVDRCLLDEVGVFRPEVVILPVASFRGQAAAAGALAVSHWSRLGARAHAVIPTSDYDHVALEMVEGADVIVLPGGVPNRLMSALAATPLHRAIAFQWEAGAGVTGSSAGAMGLFEWRLNLYPPDPFRLIPGLGLLMGFVVAPHFDRLRVRRWFKPFLGKMGVLGLLGIDESTGLVGRDGEMQVLGRGTVTTATTEGIEVRSAGSTTRLSLATSARLRIDPVLDHPSQQGQGHCPADQQRVVVALDSERRPEAALGLTA